MFITEAGTKVTASGSGRLNVLLISPGQGSSGYYSEAVLRQAAVDRVWPAGTQMFIDHQTSTEYRDRPAGSLRDLAAVLTEDAHWDDTAGGLVAEAKIYSQWREVLTDMVDDIGVSIRAAAEVSRQKIDGTVQLVIDRLKDGISVDFVTKAGRGGRVLEVLEHAAAGNAAEAASNERREQLERAIPGKSWVLDFDEDEQWVVFRTYDDEDNDHTVRQPFTVAADDLSVSLSGDPVEVRTVTTYVPAASPTNIPAETPASPAGEQTATNKEESTMAEIDDAELAALRAQADKTAAAEASAAELARRLQLIEAQTKARIHIGSKLAESKLPALAQARVTDQLVTAVTLTESGDLDTTALDDATTKAVEAEQAYLAAVSPSPVKGVTGFGQSTAAESTPKRTKTAFGREIKES